jgi:hypothetical protein
MNATGADLAETYRSEIDQFRRRGFAVFRDFYDLEREIYPIQREIHGVIRLLLDRCLIPGFVQPPFSSEDFDAGYLELTAVDRKLGGIVYDAIKQIPGVIRLLSSEKNLQLARVVRESQLVGIIARGHGVRIDNPNEDKYLTFWHQDYFGHLHSPDGLVFWVPLRDVTRDLGPVEFCVGSHTNGFFPLYNPPENKYDKATETTMYGSSHRIYQEEAIVARYEKDAPLSSIGDLVLVDFACLHRSSPNRSSRPRWTMQLRYFNFEHPVGIDYGWRGSYAFGRTWTDVHPELLVDPKDAT